MDNSFASVHPELVCEWSDKNAPLTPAQITYGSKKLYWWKGSCGHEWRASAKSRSSGEKCPYCAGMRVLPGYNDLASKQPELDDGDKTYIAIDLKSFYACKNNDQITTQIRRTSVIQST